MDVINSGFRGLIEQGFRNRPALSPDRNRKVQNHTDTAAESVFDGLGGRQEASNE
jgi:hypothetical protein